MDTLIGDGRRCGFSSRAFFFRLFGFQRPSLHRSGDDRLELCLRLCLGVHCARFIRGPLCRPLLRTSVEIGLIGHEQIFPLFVCTQTIGSLEAERGPAMYTRD